MHSTRNSVAAVTSYFVLARQVLNCLKDFAQTLCPVPIRTGPCCRVGYQNGSTGFELRSGGPNEAKIKYLASLPFMRAGFRGVFGEYAAVNSRG
jgi:hypothetical protein